MHNPEERKREILLGALKVFERDGYYKAKVSDIAKAANIGKGTIYQYFDSKKSLFKEMVKYCLDEYLEITKKKIKDECNPIKRLKIYMEIEKEMMKNYGNIANIFIKEGNIARELKQIIYKVRNEKLSIINETLKDGIKQGLFKEIDTELFSMIFLGGANQIIADELFFSDEKKGYSVDYSEVIDLFIKGIGKNETA